MRTKDSSSLLGKAERTARMRAISSGSESIMGSLPASSLSRFGGSCSGSAQQPASEDGLSEVSGADSSDSLSGGGLQVISILLGMERLLKSWYFRRTW